MIASFGIRPRCEKRNQLFKKYAAGGYRGGPLISNVGYLRRSDIPIQNAWDYWIHDGCLGTCNKGVSLNGTVHLR